MMKEYIKQGIGFTLGMGITMVAINAFNKMCGGDCKPANKEEKKPEENVEAKEMA